MLPDCMMMLEEYKCTSSSLKLKEKQVKYCKALYRYLNDDIKPQSQIDIEDKRSKASTTVKYAWHSILCELTHFNHSEVKMKNIAISSLPNELERNKSYSLY